MSGFVLLDRDGVINRRIENGYVTSWAQFAFLPGALDALRILNENDYSAIVISNQAGVGMGLMAPSDLEEITRRFVAEVESHGGRIQGVYYCIHREEDGCECRKPKPGLLLQAQRDHRFSFSDTFLVGDSQRDVLAARQVGCPALLVSDGKASESETKLDPSIPAFRSLYEAVQFLLSRKTRGVKRRRLL